MYSMYSFIRRRSLKSRRASDDNTDNHDDGSFLLCGAVGSDALHWNPDFTVYTMDSLCDLGLSI